MSDNPTPSSRLPAGFSAAGVAAKIKKNGKPDVAVIFSDRPCSGAAVFTTNRVKAAPVLRGMAQMEADASNFRAVVVNAGCANACTGAQGRRNAETTAKLAAKALSVRAPEVLVMSTGVIGAQLPMDKLAAGVVDAAGALSQDGLDAAAGAIMTTDLVPKVARVERDAFSVVGIAKGSGMIHPNMATMLGVIVTDADVPAALLGPMTRRATVRSFNSITVDGDTSTNDTLLVLANGAGGAKIRAGATARAFEAALTEVCISLAKQIARDGEGATKFITIDITGAVSEAQARRIGRTIAISPLVKTAFYGGDANWGRIVAAAGYSGEAINPDKVSLWFSGVHVFKNGAPTDYSDAEATEAMKPHDVSIRLDLGLGKAAATVWTCDMSHDYVTINGKYRT
ncbi:MAG: bifunctional glutamate N-acetyltransferase/amino-acid acetyltransferase ArgJ [Thermoflexales bacterium]|nr:bifunctional glutamate N-acetyltransferase/amino-acid acetyltransferase ArgJ [Thermoflexales bacterium]